MNKLINQYNKFGSLLVISPYPEKGTFYNRTHGIVSFAKNTVNAILPFFNQKRRKIIVLTNYNKKKDLYQEKGVLIVRCFKKNNLSLYLDLWKEIKKFNKIKDILVQFDFSLYGDFFVTGFFPFFLSFLKIFGYRLLLVLHSVVLDLKTIGLHLGYGNDFLSKIKIIIFNSFLKLFYFLFSIMTKIVVLEKEFVKRLKKINIKTKTVYIPHGVDISKKILSYKKARKILNLKKNDFLVLSFGFITWYKGADFLVNNFNKPIKIANKSIKFLLAGGHAPSLAHKKYYQDYYKRIQAKVQQSKNIKITGFIEEKNIPIYFKAADLIIFPYRTLMSSSGPLSFVYTFEKPFALSNNLIPVMKNDYFKKGIIKTKLKKDDLFFSLNRKNLINHIKKIITQRKLEKLANFSKIAKKQLLWKSIGKDWNEIVKFN